MDQKLIYSNNWDKAERDLTDYIARVTGVAGHVAEFPDSEQLLTPDVARFAFAITGGSPQDYISSNKGAFFPLPTLGASVEGQFYFRSNASQFAVDLMGHFAAGDTSTLELPNVRYANLLVAPTIDRDVESYDVDEGAYGGDHLRIWVVRASLKVVLNLTIGV